MSIYSAQQKKGAFAVLAPVAQFVGRVDQYLINPAIMLMFGVALIVFLYGMFDFLANAEDAEKRETGRSHMLWGLVGMFIMFAVYALLHMIQNTLGIGSNPIINAQ